MSFFNTAIRKKDVFMALLFYRGPAFPRAVHFLVDLDQTVVFIVSFINEVRLVGRRVLEEEKAVPQKVHLQDRFLRAHRL